MKKLTLSEAILEGKLDAFAKQAEADGIGAIDGDEFESRLGQIIAPQPEDQTSRSPDHGCSPEK